MHMEPAAQVEGGVPVMGVLIDNRPRRARAGATRKRAAPSPWLSAGGNEQQVEFIWPIRSNARVATQGVAECTMDGSNDTELMARSTRSCNA